jgi:GR25 family glycosyltransferase involved in LPS biosynthesis
MNHIYVYLLAFTLNFNYYKMSKSIYKAYIINLPDRPKRLKSITTQLNNYEIPFDVFKAISPEDIDTEVILRDLHMFSKRFDPKTKLDFKKLESSTLRKTEIGCSQSHIQVMFKIANSNSHNPVLILEDDANLLPDFYKKTENILHNIVGTWDILHVGYGFEPHDMCEMPTEKEHFCKKKPAVVLTCMHAYFINGAPAALKLLQTLNTETPEILDLRLNTATSDYFVSVPKLALQFPFPSDNGNRIDQWEHGRTGLRFYN